MKIKALDLFCGAGGLTYGLQKSGVDVICGYDLDKNMEYPFVTNNDTDFQCVDVNKLKSKKLNNQLKNSDVSILAGCAPCQQFSSYNINRGQKIINKFKMVDKLFDLTLEVKPTILAFENVPNLINSRYFKSLIYKLNNNNYYTSVKIIKAHEYGVPQTRKRLVLLASRLGPIKLISPTHQTKDKQRTVRDTIFELPTIDENHMNKFSDELHVSSKLSELNLKRIKHSKPGGTWRDWPDELKADCHKEISGKGYVSVYGRMEWDAPSPTITTQFYGFGNGRFGHPEENRAISLREGAMLQSFPKKYSFVPDGSPVHFATLGRLIGNAVPPRLAVVIGRSIIRHVNDH